MVGPVLLKQDKTEAVLAVDGRLEYIENEMYVYYLAWGKDVADLVCSKRVEKQIKDVEDKSDELRAQVSYPTYMDILGNADIGKDYASTV